MFIKFFIFLLYPFLVLCSLKEDDNESTFKNSSSINSNNSNEFIAIGDKFISFDNMNSFKETLDYWTNSQGSWVKKKDKKRLYTEIYNNEMNLATNVYSACGNVSNRVGLDYDWIPPLSNKFPLISTFSQEGLCKLLRGRTLVFVGDSLSLHLYETMLNVLGNRTVYGNSYDLKHFKPEDLYNWSQNYSYCQELYNLPNFNVTYYLWNKLSYWSTAWLDHLITINKRTGTIIIAQWGAHYEEDSIIEFEIVALMEWIDQFLDKSLFIYRTPTMAHSNCRDYFEPVNISLFPANHPQKHWNWALFPKQRLIWKKYLDRHTKNVKIYMNVYDMMSYRPDQHVLQKGGCLHYCIPGPFDSIILLFYSMLELIENLSVNEIDAII
jgi:hypothetical protein